MSARFVTLATGAKMPKIGLGTWQQTNINPKTAGSDAEEVYTAVKAAIDAGYRHIDTAWAYFNEKQVGRAVNEALKDGKVKREDLFITTKLYAQFHARDQVVPVLKTQLEALGLNYVDMYLIHGPIAIGRDPENPKAIFPVKDGVILTVDPPIDHMETWAAMEEAMDLGLTKAIGLSNFSPAQIERIHKEARIKPHCLQVECHAYFPQNVLHALCKRLNIAFMAYAPIGSPGAGAIQTARGQKFPILMEEPCVVAAAKKHNKTPAQVLIRWLYQRDMVVIPKSTNPQRIKQNIDIYDFELDKEDCDALSKLSRGRLLGGAYGSLKNHPQYPWAEGEEH